MPKIAALQSGFNAGELSPLYYGVTDSPRYKKGLQTCLNYIPTLQGPLMRRPGTKYMNAVKDSSNPPILVPFQFSITQAYVLEFGDQYIRFYANNGQVVTTGTSFKVVGAEGVVSASQPFFATRADLTPMLNEHITSSASPSPGAILELQTPYLIADLPLLRWVQSEDTLFLVHPNYPPMKLQRYGQTYWTLRTIYFQDGPYMAYNSHVAYGDSTAITLTPDGTAGIINLTTGPSFTISGAANNGSGLIRIHTSTAYSYTNGTKVFIKNVVGTVEANNDPGGTAEPPTWTISVVDSTHFDLIGSTFVHAWISGGTVYPALFSLLTTDDTHRTIALISGGKRYWGQSLIATDASEISFAVDPSNTLPGTAASTAWQMSVWCPKNGYPSIAAFHQNRLFLCAPPSFPQEIDASVVGNYENFAPSDPTTLSVADSNALSFNLNSQDSNAIQWMTSNAQGLLTGSRVAEWALTPDGAGAALTPTNFNAQQTSYFGSASVPALQVGNAAVYVQRAQRKIREMHFFFQLGTFRSTDVTDLSEHITLPSITQLALQKETQPLVWALKSDGNLISMIYNRDDEALSIGWTRHQLGGQSDSGGTNPVVTSIAVIPSQDLSFDQMWMVVKRYINGSTVYGLEYMTKVFDDSILQEDAFQLDCGFTYYSPKIITAISHASPAIITSAAHGFSNGDQIKIVDVIGMNQSTTDANGNITVTNLVNEKTFVVAGVTTNTFALNDFSGNAIDSTSFGIYVTGGHVSKLVSTITGLTWLENETVTILCDGALVGPVVVSNSGAITLPIPAAKVQIGYSYNSDGMLLRQEGGAADGTSIGKTRRTTRVAVQMHRAGDLAIGTDLNNLIPVKFTQVDQVQADNATPLFSGILRDGVESAYDFESQVCFRQNSALPGCIQSITSFMEESDV